MRLFETYIEKVFYSLSRLGEGVILDNLIDEKDQSSWLQDKIMISGIFASISPNFKTILVGVDEGNFRLSLLMNVPVVDVSTPFKYMGV